MKRENKRWLMSMMKTSGSRRRNVQNGRYADTRNSRKETDLEELPQYESMKSTRKFYNGKINYGLLVRFLRNKVGADWDELYSEIISRIPTKLLDYKEMVFWFVADKVEFIDGRPCNKKSQQFIWMGESFESVKFGQVKQTPEFKEFYVHPDTNKLTQINIKKYRYKRERG